MDGIPMMQAALAAMARAISAAPHFDLPNLIVESHGRQLHHRSPGGRAHRNWRRRRAAGRA